MRLHLLQEYVLVTISGKPNIDIFLLVRAIVISQITEYIGERVVEILLQLHYVCKSWDIKNNN